MKRSLLSISLVSIFTAITAHAADLRIGMIGLDTSHVVEFTRRFNDPNDKNFIPGGKVVVAYKGGSKDIPSSWNRVEGFTKTLTEKFGVKLVDSVEALCEEVDVVMLESVDGRPHLEQAKPVIKAKKPLFIDKPLAGSLRDALEIYRLAHEAKVPIYSGSSLRFYPGLMELKSTSIGELKNAISTGPANLEPHHPDLFWYGVHSTEALYTIMGTGCETVTCTATPSAHIVTGVWKGGKVGTLVGLRDGAAPYRVSVYGTKGSADQKPGGDYTPFLQEVMKFLQTGVSPVSSEETMEIIAFMEAADESKRQGGCPVKIADVMKKAKAK